MAPRAFRAAQQPFPTYEERTLPLIDLDTDVFTWKTKKRSHLKEASHLTVPAYDHLFASEHDICGSLQAREV